MEKKTSKPTSVRKPTAAQLKKKAELASERIAINLDNYLIATDIFLSLIQIEGTTEEVKLAANEGLLEIINKVRNL